MLGAMPTGHRTSWRTGFLARVAGSVAVFGLATLALCQCGSAFSTTTSLRVSDADVGDEDAGESDVTIVVVSSPHDAQVVVDASPDGPDETDADAGSSSCDPTKDPKDEPCLVNSGFGVFVSGTTGHDTAAGTKADPLRTIAEGIAKASAGSKRVFACAGAYDEHVVMGLSDDGTSVYGGFDCAGWRYAPTNSVKVAPSTTGYALEVDLLKLGATFEDVEFDSQSAKVAGASSVAVFANQSSVTFRRIVVTSGDGASGAQGDAGTNYTLVQAPSGNNGDGGAGGANQVCTCLNGDPSVGGAGGAAGPPSSAGLPGSPALGGGKQGGGGTGSCAFGTGGDGSPARDADAGSGAATWGALSAGGWSAANGTNGNIASVAQGGGGGGGNVSFLINDAGLSASGGGGSGGCGGCGGGGGTPGAGGGSSFALLSYRSTVVLVDSRLAAHDGKNGGNGGKGQPGQMGGYAGTQSQPGCPGGNGGAGGSGGGGGGGGGGLSAAEGYVGSPATEMGTVSKTFGNAGTGGTGGTGGGPNNGGSKGKDGTAASIVSL